MKKLVAVVLGGTVPHISLIQELKRRGYIIVLVDYFQNPPAARFSDYHERISTLDHDLVLKVATNYSADLVISTCIDQANLIACYVSEKLGLPKPYNYDTAESVTNKVLMKEILKRNDILTANYYECDDFLDVDSDSLNYPLIVKPSDSNSSKGIQKITSNDQLKDAIESAINLSRNGKAIVEEFIDGIEIGIDCFVTTDDVEVLMVKERRKITVLENSVQQIYGCIWPKNLEFHNNEIYRNVALQISLAFGLTNTPLMIQALEKDGSIYVIEFAPRIGGGESHRIIHLSTGFDFISSAVSSFLQEVVHVDFSAPSMYYAESFIYTTGGCFGKIVGLDKFLQNGDLVYYEVLKSEGMFISDVITSNNRVGVFVVNGASRSEVLEKISHINNGIEVYSDSGAPIMNRLIYYN